MKKIIHWLDENLEEFILILLLIGMTIIMGIQVLCRYALGMSLSWSEELTRYLFIWSGFISVSYCSKKCLSIKIEQFVAIFPRRGAPFVSFILVAFRILQRWIIEFRIARGEQVFDPAHPERNTPESFIEANTDPECDPAAQVTADNRINNLKKADKEVL